LPIYYGTVDGMDPNSTDEAIALVAKTQWKDLRKERLLDEDSAGYRTAVAGLAERVAEIVRTVAEVSEEPPTGTLIGATGAAVVTRGTGAERATDDGEGWLEMLAAGEAAIPGMNATLQGIIDITSQIGGLAGGATGAVQESDRRNRGFAGRLAVTRRLGERLEDPSQRLHALGQEYARNVVAANPMVLTLLDAAEKDEAPSNEVDGFLDATVNLGKATSEAMESQRGLVRSLQENIKLSRSLQTPTQRIVEGLRGVSDGSSVIGEWAKRAEAIRASRGQG
jgi:hypothetical protein